MRYIEWDDWQAEVVRAEQEYAKQEHVRAIAEMMRRAMEYSSIGRKLLLVDELPQGALARYERDVASVGHVMDRQQYTLEWDEWYEDVLKFEQSYRDRIIEEEEIILPAFELESCQTIKLSEIKSRCFNLVDKHALR